jgi:hypothetical protein
MFRGLTGAGWGSGIRLMTAGGRDMSLMPPAQRFRGLAAAGIGSVPVTTGRALRPES